MISLKLAVPARIAEAATDGTPLASFLSSSPADIRGNRGCESTPSVRSQSRTSEISSRFKHLVSSLGCLRVISFNLCNTFLSSTLCDSTERRTSVANSSDNLTFQMCGEWSLTSSWGHLPENKKTRRAAMAARSALYLLVSKGVICSMFVRGCVGGVGNLDGSHVDPE